MAYGEPGKAALRPEQVRTHLAPVIVGGSYLGYSYVRSFHETYGLTSTVISSIDVKMTSTSRFCDYRVFDGANDEERLVAYLSELGREITRAGKVGLLVGAADWHARVLSSHKTELSEWYVVPYIDFELLDDITQKERFYEICEELGIPYPTTRLLDCGKAEADPEVLAAFSYPCIAKPSNSASYDLVDFPGKEKVYTAKSAEDLARIHGLMHEAGYAASLIVQDKIPGEDDAIRSLTTFSDASGDMRVVSGGRVVLQDHSPQFIGNPCVILGERIDEVVEHARAFLKHTGYRGYANFDVMYDERDGQYKFFEVNTRAGRNTYYVSLGGVPFVRPIVEEFVLAHEIPYQEAFDFLYTVVPASVVRRHVADDLLRDRTLALFREGKAGSPMSYEPESVAQKFWSGLTEMRQISKFNKWY